MKIKMRIHNKMLVLILLTASVIFGLSIAIVSKKIRENSIVASKIQAQSNAGAFSQKARAFILNYITAAKTIDDLILVYGSIDEKDRLKMYETILKSILYNSPSFISIRTSIEPMSILNDSNHINISYHRTANSIEYDNSNIATTPLYQLTKNKLSEIVLTPHQQKYNTTSILQNSYSVPIMEQHRFIGTTVINGYASDFQAYLRTFLSDKSEVIFIANDKNEIISHTVDSLVGQNIMDIGYDKEFVEQYTSSKTNNQIRSLECKSPIFKENYYFSISPFKISNNVDNYVLILASPISFVQKQANKNYYLSFITGMAGMVILGGFVWMVLRLVSAPITSTARSLQKVALGEIDYKYKLRTTYNDELSDVAKSVNRLIDGLNSIARFASEIGEGNLDTEYKLLGKNDLLGQSLKQMHQSLVQSKIEEEKQKQEDDKQSWVTHGIANFVEILRLNNDKLETFSANIVSNICMYMGKPQCALYIHNDDEENPEFELVAAHAYGHHKIVKKSVKVGEELVGRVAQNRKTLHIKNTTQNFVTIRPELTGDEIPTSLLITPLLSGEIIIGVIEMVGYEPFETHEIEFVEKLGANIASTLNSAKTNIKTAVLLDQSREQKDELAQHEEEMRQNMEEMMATHEETEKRESELKSILDTINSNSLCAILTLDGKIYSISESFAELLGYPISQLQGKLISTYINRDEISRKEHDLMWTDILSGISQKRIQQIEIKKQTIYLSETYVPVTDQYNRNVESVALVAVDVTKKVEYDKEISKLIAEIESYSK